MVDEQAFSETISHVARELLAEPGVEQTLDRAVALAVRHLRGAACASVSIVHGTRRVDTPASTDVRAYRADALQYELEQGPCLDAIWRHETFEIVDFAADERYPTWSRRVLEETGLRSSLSFQLFTAADSLGALNLYALRPRAFDTDDRSEGLVFAAHAAVALQSAQTEQQLRDALDTRSVVGRAEGILMERYRITADAAFEILRRSSNRRNVRLRDIAQHLVDTGEEPG